MNQEVNTMQGKTQTEDVRIVQPTEDKPGEYLVKVGGVLVDYANPDLFKTDQRTLEPIQVHSGTVWTMKDR